MIFGTYDILILMIVLGLNAIILSIDAILNYKILIISLGVLLYLIVIPYTSARLEAIQVRNEYELVDSFNLLYLYFRFPTYWLLGILNFVIVIILIQRRPSNQLNTLLKRAIRIASKANCIPIYTYSAANDLQMMLEELQNNFENGDTQTMEKLSQIFSPSSEWVKHFGNEPLRKKTFSLITKIKDNAQQQ